MFMFVGLCVCFYFRILCCLKYVCIGFVYVHVCGFLCVVFPDLLLFEFVLYWVFACSILWVFVFFISRLSFF